jgi:hypothetical protein
MSQMSIVVSQSPSISGVNITNVSCVLADSAQVVSKSPHKYPFVKAVTSTYTYGPDNELLEKGWLPDGKSYFRDDDFYYHKVLDVHKLISHIEISFTKTTDDRDRQEFGFTQNSMRGIYTCPVPDTILEDVARTIFEGKKIDQQQKEAIASQISKGFVDKEFEMLRMFRDEHLEALNKARNSKLSDEEQKTAYLKVTDQVKAKYPAFNTTVNERSQALISENLVAVGFYGK